MPRPTLKEQVASFTNERLLSIAHPLQRYMGSDTYWNLPRHAKMHWRGLLQPASGAVNGKFQIDERLLPAVPPSGRRPQFEPYGDVILCHCKTALSHLGLKLPGKPNHRREAWPGLLTALGFDIELFKDVSPTRHTAMSDKMIREYRDRYPNRKAYV